MNLSKKELRILSLGFLVSGALVAIIALVITFTGRPPQSEEGQTDLAESQTLEESTSLAEEGETIAIPVPDANDESSQDDQVEEESDEENQSEENEDEDTDSNTDRIEGQLVIQEGDSSKIIADNLENAGIIGDAEEFDQFLMNNGYSSRLQPGPHEVHSDMNYEELAQSLIN